MRSTFKILFYINRAKVKADGTTAVLCRVTIDGKQTVISTGIFCDPDEWDTKKQELKDTKTNKRLLTYRKNIQDFYERILKENGVVSAELLKTIINGNNTTPTFLLQAGEVERERLRKRSLEINSTSTYRQSKTTQSNLRDFVLSREMEDIEFSAITEEFGESFKTFLKKNLGYKNTHVNHCLCWLNRLIYIAVDKEVIRYNPLEDVEYEKKNPPKLRHISRNELKLIMETPMPYEMQELARRTFIFSSFTGLAFVDVKTLYPCHIELTSDGRKYIRKNRVKTEVEAFIPLHPVADKIISLYNTTDFTQPVFPLPKRDVLWFEIHELGIGLGFKENLSYHMARHSFGTLLLTAGIPIESISKMMGHTSIKSTQVYSKVTDEKISEDMDRLMKRRKKQL